MLSSSMGDRGTRNARVLWSRVTTRLKSYLVLVCMRMKAKTTHHGHAGFPRSNVFVYHLAAINHYSPFVL